MTIQGQQLGVEVTVTSVDGTDVNFDGQNNDRADLVGDPHDCRDLRDGYDHQDQCEKSYHTASVPP